MASNSTGNKREEGGQSGDAHRGQFGGDRGVGSALAEKARDTASGMASKAQEAVSNVGNRAEEAVSAVGGGMKSLAETIRGNAPDRGVLGTASANVASALEQGGRHLQEAGLSGLGQDLTNFIRRNPIPTLFVGIGIGYLLARATRS